MQKLLAAGVTGFFDADSLWEIGVDLRDAIEAEREVAQPHIGWVLPGVERIQHALNSDIVMLLGGGGDREGELSESTRRSSMISTS